ncbi:MAG TPA: hypothetical protein VGE02_13050 [Gemmatimonadales bacterium]
MQHDTPLATGTMEWGVNRQLAAKQRTAVHHEVVRLLDALAPELPPPRREVETVGVRAYRWPGRCILQGESRAVSVSWFPGGRDDESLGEMMIISWKGVVSLPGSARRAPDQAEALVSLLLHPAASETGIWEWCTEEGATTFETPELAEYCREQVGN